MEREDEQRQGARCRWGHFARQQERVLLSDWITQLSHSDLHISHLFVPSVCPPSFILSRSCGGGRGTMTGSGTGASGTPWCFLLCFLCFLCFRLWMLCKPGFPSPAGVKRTSESVLSQKNACCYFSQLVRLVFLRFQNYFSFLQIRLFKKQQCVSMFCAKEEKCVYVCWKTDLVSFFPLDF